ncbi:MAG TPA: hypothetical protein VFP97_06650 [Chitinophagaceae bacterium]|nr:hypothetical protein [Chitinophagaceae bacterium]
MKIIATVITFVLFTSCASSKETNYTGSTPASVPVRIFLGIPTTDSIDFIRWKLSINSARYTLECNYGIGKPNTNGFYDGGKNVSFSGSVKEEKNMYLLQNGNHTLKFAGLNNNLLHIVNEDNTLMIGNGGWSYAINKTDPSPDDQLTLPVKETVIKDSIAFQGRTPCGVPGVIKSQQCYKLKWYLVLYGDPAKNEPLSFRVLGTGYRLEGGKQGKWEINTTNNGKIIYNLLDENGDALFRLLKLDEGVLIFTDEKGNLLVGDHDFSYTLNRKF